MFTDRINTFVDKQDIFLRNYFLKKKITSHIPFLRKLLKNVSPKRRNEPDGTSNWVTEDSLIKGLFRRVWTGFRESNKVQSSTLGLVTPLGLKRQGAGVVNETRDKRQRYLVETTRQAL